MNPLLALYEYGKAHGLDLEMLFEERIVNLILRVGEAGDVTFQRLERPKGRGVPMHLPIRIKRTSGIKPNFPADNAAYVLGLDSVDKPDPEWTALCHQAYIELLDRAATEVDDPALSLVSSVLRRRPGLASDPSVAAAKVGDLDILIPATLEGGRWVPLGERPAVKEWWRKNYAALQGQGRGTDMCLVTGERLPMTRIHPLVTGMKGGRSTGVTLMSFNEPATESFGRSQAEVSPVSVDAAVLCSKALTRIVSRRSGRRRSIILPGDIHVCVISRRLPGEAAADFVLSLLEPEIEDFSPETFEGRERLIWKTHRALFRAPFRGGLPEIPDAPLDLLVLKPNGARVEFRSYMELQSAEIYDNLRLFFRDLSIIDPFTGEVRSDFVLRTVWPKKEDREKGARAVRGLLDCLVDGARNVQRGGDESRSPLKDLAVSTYMAALTGGPFPPAMLRLALEKAVRDSHKSKYGAVSVECAAALKAIVNRTRRKSGMEEVTDMLDPSCANPDYLNGRLLAAAERIQEIAIPGVVASVVKRFYESAMRYPARAMPHILSDLNHHVAKIHRAKPGLAVWCSKLAGGIVNLLPADREKAFPTNRDLPEQAMFNLGYFHQRTHLFTKKEEPAGNGNGSTE